jgi:acetylornithine aminotransferase
MARDKLPANAERVGNALMQGLRQALAGTRGVIEVRGQGLMIGIELERPCGDLVHRARQAGLLINVTRERVVRLLPPLILDESQAAQIIDILVPLIKTFLAESLA